MKVVVYNIRQDERLFFDEMNRHHLLQLVEDPLSLATVDKAQGQDVVCCFVTDCLNSEVIQALVERGVRLIALRSSGFDHVDLVAAKRAQLTVVRVPHYSPEAIAEFAVALILALNRHLITAYLRGLDYNFSLNGLMGFNLYQKTVGIIGTGHIGTAFAQIMHGFGCRLLAVDLKPNKRCKQLKVNYVSFDELLQASDIVSLHCDLNEQTKHLIDAHALARMKPHAMLINTGRGALCDTEALIHALESGQLGCAGLDVYDKERGLFFQDHHADTLRDPLFLKLQALPNVMITPHQAFLTREAVSNIVQTTLDNITAFEQGVVMNQV